MTPKEKAKELYSKYEFVYIQNYTSSHEVKQCALIAVENAVENIESINSKMINDNFKEALLIYWEAVKNEINRL